MDVQDLKNAAAVLIARELEQLPSNITSTVRDGESIVDLAGTDGEQSQAIMIVTISCESTKITHRLIVGWSKDEEDIGFVCGDDGSYLAKIWYGSILLYFYFDLAFPTCGEC